MRRRQDIMAVQDKACAQPLPLLRNLDPVFAVPHFGLHSQARSIVTVTSKQASADAWDTITPAPALTVRPNLASRVVTRQPCLASTFATESWTISQASLTAASMSARLSRRLAVAR